MSNLIEKVQAQKDREQKKQFERELVEKEQEEKEQVEKGVVESLVANESNSISVSLEWLLPNFSFKCEMNLPASGVTAIWGQSGSGKTTLLRCLAGLEKQARGDVKFCGEAWQTGRRLVPAHRRPIGYVFQEASLFPHLSVRDNLDFGRKRADTLGDNESYQQIIELLGIEGLLERNPEKLSGGERQRIAIARAILLKPKLLLMDEPLASLDDGRKSQFLEYLRNLLERFPIPVLYVSHSLKEVTRIADRLVVMHQGSVISNGELIESMIEQQIGQSSREPFSLLEGVVAKVESQQGLTEVLIGRSNFKIPLQSVKALQKIRLHLNAKDVSLCLNKPSDSSILNIIECQVSEVNTIDSGQSLVKLQFSGGQLLAVISQYSCDHLKIESGLSLFAQIKAVSIVR